MAPYDALAPHYEAFMGEASESDSWHRRLLALASAHGVAGGRALDVGCGTGRSLASFRDAGFGVAGSDPSAGMLAVARERLGANVPLEVAALPDLGPGEPVDLVTAINDVLNYVAPQDLGAAVRALAGRLAPGGVLLFDANTPLTYSSFFSATFCRTTPGRFFVWQGLESAPHADGSTTHRADLHAFEAAAGDHDGCWHHSVSHQVQHQHPHERVTAAIDAAGLTLLAVHGQREGAPPDPICDETIHTKRIYIARLP